MKQKKKSKRTPDVSANVSARRSLPVDRYYSSSSSKRSLSKPRLSDGQKTQESGATLLLRLLKGIFRLGGVVLIGIVLVMNIGLNSVGVKIGDNGAVIYRERSEYVDAVQSAFRASLLYKSKLTFNSSKFEQRVMDGLPELSGAVAVVPLAGTKLQVGLEFAQPVLRVRLDNLRQGIVGEGGKLLYEANTSEVLSKFSKLPLMNLEPAVRMSVGDQLLTSEEVELIELLMVEFDGGDEHRPTIDSFTHDIEHRELQVRFHGTTGYFAKLVPGNNPRAQVGALVATMKNLFETNSLPTSYIDVRVDGRVFVL